MQRFLCTLTGLQLLPAGRNGLAVGSLGFPENVRMTAFQLIADGVTHLVEVKQPLLLAHLGVEHHLEQQVPQFVTQIAVVLTFDSVQYLVGFFQRVRSDGGEGLFAVPWATDLRIAQRFHDGQQAVQWRRLGHKKVSDKRIGAGH